jgi:hypothetical protein
MYVFGPSAAIGNHTDSAPTDSPLAFSEPTRNEDSNRTLAISDAQVAAINRYDARKLEDEHRS